MKKLKTLKDLDFRPAIVWSDFDTVVKDILRGKALEWIDSLEIDLKKYNKINSIHDVFETAGRIAWIKYFFNLEE